MRPAAPQKKKLLQPRSLESANQHYTEESVNLEFGDKADKADKADKTDKADKVETNNKTPRIGAEGSCFYVRILANHRL